MKKLSFITAICLAAGLSMSANATLLSANRALCNPQNHDLPKEPTT